MDVTSYMLGKKAGGGTITETDPIFSNSAASGITSTDIGNWNDKQDGLVSGTNIKTINNESILGSGNIEVQGGGTTYTAGDYIDITNNVIKGDYPLYFGENGIPEKSAYNNYTTILMGRTGAKTGNYSTIIGCRSNVYNTTYHTSLGYGAGWFGGTGKSHAITIGSDAGASANNTIALGDGSRASHQNAVALGHGATTTKTNQLIIGGQNNPINEASLYTSNGIKNFATEDYVDTAISTAITSALGGNY